jgi:hypothetical protein
LSRSFSSEEDVDETSRISPFSRYVGVVRCLDSFKLWSGDDHPVHFHRHTFELTRIGEKTTAGILKDTVNVPRRQSVEIDFVADDPGLTLYHCHMQLHIDFGFIGLMKYA